ncbi:MAG: hypothetical protein IJG45_07165 [Oscillospiraceae bacterium]|nr:hypothetical protein [Oscillospiraceae bacterium]
MKKRREFEDDDGRQIANMNVDGMPWYMPKSSSSADSDHSEPVELTREEKWSLYGGILKAVLLVSAAFIGVYFLVVFLLTRIW